MRFTWEIIRGGDKVATIITHVARDVEGLPPTLEEGVNSVLEAERRSGVYLLHYDGWTTVFEAAVRGDDDCGGLSSILTDEEIVLEPRSYIGEADAAIRSNLSRVSERAIAGEALRLAQDGELTELAQALDAHLGVVDMVLL